MGCFAGLRSKKKKSEKVVSKHASFTDSAPTKLPEPDEQGRTFMSAPPSFKNRPKAIQPTSGELNSRARVLSDPSIFSGPLPLPPSAVGGLRRFSYDEIAGACQYFSADLCMSEGLSSVSYKASFGDDFPGKKFDATVTRISSSTQSLKDFLNEVNTIGSLQHPNLCKLLGFHAREDNNPRMLVYEKLFHGSLEQLLSGRYNGPPIDWGNRVKVALCTARGLAFLHEEGPFQAMYREFSSANIHVDKDFRAKLSGYGCALHNRDAETSNACAGATLAPETEERGVLTPKSNVWSFGIVLVELLTGRKIMDSRLPREERNLIKWSKPYLTDECRLSLVMDNRLKGRIPLVAARSVADIALKCLQREPSERPTMRAIVESLENIQDLRQPSRFPIQEPSSVTGKKMLKSTSFNGVVISRAPRTTNLSLSPPTRNRSSVSTSPPRPSLGLPLPPRTCACSVSPDVSQLSGPMRKSVAPAMRRASVEGF